MVISGIKIDPKRLYTRQQALDIMKEGGETDRALSKIREKYESKFGNELVWRYPIMVGEALGAVIIPVQEGFLSIAYNDMNPEDYEIYDLDNHFLLSDVDIASMIESWKEYSKGLLSALRSMERILLKQE